MQCRAPCLHGHAGSLLPSACAAWLTNHTRCTCRSIKPVPAPTALPLGTGARTWQAQLGASTGLAALRLPVWAWATRRGRHACFPVLAVLLRHPSHMCVPPPCQTLCRLLRQNPSLAQPTCRRRKGPQPWRGAPVQCKRQPNACRAASGPLDHPARKPGCCSMHRQPS